MGHETPWVAEYSADIGTESETVVGKSINFRLET